MEEKNEMKRGMKKSIQSSLCSEILHNSQHFINRVCISLYNCVCMCVKDNKHILLREYWPSR